ncbi:MAG: DUF4129 domain-containing protein [Gorillibacterium sp.]|nr:DUF4129 domain-containing protein [Gorillibacterium sp.]
MANIQEDKEKLRQILQQSEYSNQLPNKSNSINPIKAWLEKLWQWLLDLFPDASISPGAPKLLALITLLLVVAVLAFVIVRLVSGIAMGNRMSGHARGVFHDATELGLSYRQLLLEARSSAESGDYREAVRRMFLAALLLLNEQEWVSAEKWKTNHEYLEELQEHNPTVVPTFVKAAQLFERVYYGSEHAEELEYKRLSALLSPLWSEGGTE